jgi:hypothetical protein
VNSNRGTYVASRTRHAAMWRAVRAEGYRINSTWIDEAGPGQTADMAELWERIAREVSQSALLVLYIEPEDFPLKGALVEVGMAIGSLIPVHVVAPRVTLDASFRPIGSWMRHSIVRVFPDVDTAMADADLDM